MRVAALSLLILMIQSGCGTGSESVRSVIHVVPERYAPRRPKGAEDDPIAWVRVGSTPETRQHGLMFVDDLDPDRGMLFVYPEARILSFWMKNVRIPLSIAFADPAGRIVRILEMEPLADGAPEVHYESLRPAVFALEMNRGWFREKGIEIGDVLSLHPEIQALPVR